MRFLIIGHSVEDHINESGDEFIKPGGIFYTAFALNYLKDSEDEILLCTSVGKDNLHLFSPLYKNLDQKYFQLVEEIPKVFLKIHKNEEREEIYKNITGGLKINFDEISSFDGILINMITGFDISLEQMRKIRKEFKGLIYLDVHTFSRGLDSDMKRYFRIIPNFSEWAKNVDIIQVNQNELMTLTADKDQHTIIEKILKIGVKFIIVTKGKLGASVYFLNDGEINSIFKSSIKINTKNNVGCGDVFGAAFFYNYFKTNNVSESLEKANIAGGAAALHDDMNELISLKDDVIKRYN